MDFLEMMKRRESCRAYSDRPVSREQLMNIVEAGRLSPSGCNAQPWHFIVVDEPEAKEKLCEAFVLRNGKTACAFRDQVPAFIVLCDEEAQVMRMVRELYNGTQRYVEGDVGMACMNMCYEALEQGLSTCILGVYEEDMVRDALGIPEERSVRMILAVGYAEKDDAPREKVRRSVEEICSFNKW